MVILKENQCFSTPLRVHPVFQSFQSIRNRRKPWGAAGVDRQVLLQKVGRSSTEFAEALLELHTRRSTSSELPSLCCHCAHWRACLVWLATAGLSSGFWKHFPVGWYKHSAKHGSVQKFFLNQKCHFINVIFVSSVNEGSIIQKSGCWMENVFCAALVMPQKEKMNKCGAETESENENYLTCSTFFFQTKEWLIQTVNSYACWFFKHFMKSL